MKHVSSVANFVVDCAVCAVSAVSTACYQLPGRFVNNTLAAEMFTCTTFQIKSCHKTAHNEQIQNNLLSHIKPTVSILFRLWRRRSCDFPKKTTIAPWQAVCRWESNRQLNFYLQLSLFDLYTSTVFLSLFQGKTWWWSTSTQMSGLQGTSLHVLQAVVQRC